MITYRNEISTEAYHTLRHGVGWKALDSAQAARGLKNSAYLISAWDGGLPAGMARVISDGGYMFLIVDVMVLPEYQGRGIGREMMNRINSWIDELARDGSCIMVNLMATPGNESFYEKLGFVTRPNHHMGAGMVRWING